MRKLKIVTYAGVLALLAIACRKQDFILPPVGEKIPFTDTLTITLKEALAKSSTKLFYQAWQRSTMDSRIKAIGNSKSTFTILAPSDAAMENAGYNAKKIELMELKDLDSLMMFYTIPGRISVEELANRVDNYIATSMCSKIGLRVNMSTANTDRPTNVVPYYYQQRLQVKAGKTYANGKVVGEGKFIAAKDGYIWLLDKMIVKPEKTIESILKDDGHFTMLLGILDYTDKQYNELLKKVGVFGLGRKSYLERYNWRIIPPRNAWDNSSVNLIKGTALLPRDEVFRKAGFNSVEDLINFNLKRGLPYAGRDAGGRRVLIGNFATDSLLSYHLDFGISLDNRKITNWGLLNFGFYTNEMDSPNFSNTLVYITIPDNGGIFINYNMPFSFSRDAASSKIQLKIKDIPNAAVATIVESDIPTLMGPIHVVDHFLTPQGFKIN